MRLNIIMADRTTGRLVDATLDSEPYQAYVPNPLPPEPPLAIDADIFALLERANLALGRLDGLTAVLPDTKLFIYLYVRKEALLSSQIEGTQSSLSDLLLYENEEVPGVPIDDVEEVSCYVAAVNHGLRRMRDDGFPLSLRLIREVHEILLSGGRGSTKTPGEFRRSQNWIGGSRPSTAKFVPPPPGLVEECLYKFEEYLHLESPPVPLLIKAAIAHVQFETIHPFLDGNGRLGRLLITLLLCSEGALTEPVLYLSLYFKTNRIEYYEWLQRVRFQGDWEGWVKFFLHGVTDTASQAADAAKRIIALFEEDRAKLDSIGRASGTAVRLYQLLQQAPLMTIPRAVKTLQLSAPAITAGFENLSRLGIVREVSGRRRGRVFAYDRYLNELQQGADPLRR